YFLQALALLQKITSLSEPHVEVFSHLATIAAAQGEFNKAEDYAHRQLEITERLDPDTLHLAGAMNNLAVILIKRGDVEQAEALLHKTLRIAERFQPTSLPKVANCLHNLGTAAREKGRFGDAQEYYRRALVIKEQQNPNTPTLASTINALGIVATQKMD